MSSPAGGIPYISLQPLRREEIEWARQLHNDPEVLDMLTDPHKVTPEEQEHWFEKLQVSKSSQRLVTRIDGQRFGIVRIDNLDQSNRSVCIGLDIHKDFRGKGLARPVYFALFEKFFVQEDINRIWLLVAGYNERAIHIYRSLGFVKEGVQRQGLYKNRNFHDYVMMSILREEYFKHE